MSFAGAAASVRSMSLVNTRLAALFAIAAVSAHCRGNEDSLEVRPPRTIMRALSIITELGAGAQLVPKGDAPLPRVPLTRGEDGSSFSGFIAAEPGDYTLELIFSGIHASSTERLFLGRWTSDAFTVVRGQSATPVFSQKLDTIGRPEDLGDTDNDALGLLDELLWNTDRTLTDSDGDFINDGADCGPTDRLDTFVIAPLGTIEDCDGDGSLRPDLPISTPGDDCDDRDPSISPRAEDECGDGLDRDCNPATCEGDTGGGPTITLLEPAASSTVGCHRRIAARIRDGAGVSGAQVLFLDDAQPPMTVETVALQAEPNNVYATPTLDTATSVFLQEGPQKLLLRATSNRGASSEYPFSINFGLGVPVTTVLPAAIGEQTMPFQVTVNTSAPYGIASISLMMSRVAGDGSVARAAETMVGRVEEQNSGTFTIDPGPLAAGDYAIYPVVIDKIGNELRPGYEFSNDATAGATTDADYLCLFDPGGDVPIRTLVKSGPPQPGFEPAKMRDHLAEAIAAAAARDANAQLVEIRGDGIQTDGFIALNQRSPEGDGKYWTYTFFNFTDERRVQVRWYSAAYEMTNPEVEVTEMDPFGFSFEPLAMVPALVDSDTAVLAYAMSPTCPPITGDDSQLIRYESNQPFSADDVVRVDVGDATWRATAVPPITVLDACE